MAWHTMFCAWCGERFAARRRDARYCGAPCRVAAWRSENLSRTVYEGECAWCGEGFYADSRLALYCSRACRQAKYREKKSRERELD